MAPLLIMKKILTSPVYFTVLLGILIGCIAMKYYLANAPLHQLKFLLLPPTLFVEVFYSSNAVWNPEHGYVFALNNMHIGRSCAAINFLALFISAASTYAFIKFDRSQYLKAFALVVLLSYPITILINSLRIVCLVMIEQHTSMHNDTLHEAVGAGCFFGALVLMFSTTEKFYRRLHHNTITIKP